jgi:hypothetical protein
MRKGNNMTDLQKVILDTLEQEIVDLTHEKYSHYVRQEDYEDTARYFIRWLATQYKDKVKV